MNLTNHDWALIEQALREAIGTGTDYQRLVGYRSVLTKLQTVHPSDMENRSRKDTGMPEMDGLRFDYDDSAGFL